MDAFELQLSAEINDDEFETVIDPIRIVLLGKIGGGEYLPVLLSLDLERLDHFIDKSRDEWCLAKLTSE